METLCINPGLKTVAVITMKWVKKGNVTVLYLFKSKMGGGHIKKDSNGKYSGFVMEGGVSKKLTENVKADIAMQTIHNYLGLK